MDLSELAKLYDFTGKTAVVTGGMGMLGSEIAVTLVGLGANVALLDIKREVPGKMRSAVDAAPGECIAVRADVLKRGLLEAAHHTIEDNLGRVDILINAAGGNQPEAIAKPDSTFFDLSYDGLGSVTNLNLIGTILPCQVFGKGMAERGKGVILNISSMSAFRPLTNLAAYSAAKAAVNNFTQWLAVHMAEDYDPRIRVNAVAPGFFLTPQNRFMLIEERTEDLTPRGQTILNHTPMGRFGQAEDLLGAVLWLVCPASEFVTGIVVPVDGGFSAYSGV